MTKKKPKYVTKEEFVEHINDSARHNVTDFGFRAFMFISFWVLVAALVFARWHGVQWNESHEVYCAQNETIKEPIYSFDNGNTWHNGNCSVGCWNAIIGYTIVTTNRCLDWKWRDKV